jgi:hypothetical protein
MLELPSQALGHEQQCSTQTQRRTSCLQALDTCEALKEEEKRRTLALEDAILGLREVQSTRDMRRAESALRPLPRPQGPLQLTGAAQLRPLSSSAADCRLDSNLPWGLGT